MTTDETCDVLVIGSGAGGLSAAVTAAYHGLKVIVVEKEPLIGGTTAISGGWMWIPQNGPEMRAGFDDSREKARAYIEHTAGPFFNAESVDAFLENGPKAVKFFERHTALQFNIGSNFPDYFPDAPGAMPGGRPLNAQSVDGRLLGPDFQRLRPPAKEIAWHGLMLETGEEQRHFFNLPGKPGSMFYVARRFAQLLFDLVRYKRTTYLTTGNALIARLVKSCRDLLVSIRTQASARGLIHDSNGRVAGAIIETTEGTRRIEARIGVVLATGGFARDTGRRRMLIPHEADGYEDISPAPPGNSGDGLRMAEALGVKLDTQVMSPAAWAPMSRPTHRDRTSGSFPNFTDRHKPGVIAVSPAGRRFVCEQETYHDVCRAMYDHCTKEGVPVCAFFIADHPTFRRYGLGYAKPAPFPYRHLIRSGYLARAETLDDLARQIGVNAAALEETVARFNQFAQRGEDPEFGRGATDYHRSRGDAEHKPSPSIGPIEIGPFYAVKVYIGDMGTFAGLPYDRHARVLDAHGDPVPGLYVAGTDGVAVLGGTYPGGGTLIGPAVTFGYVAGMHMSNLGTTAPDPKL